MSRARQFAGVKVRRKYAVEVSQRPAGVATSLGGTLGARLGGLEYAGELCLNGFSRCACAVSVRS